MFPSLCPETTDRHTYTHRHISKKRDKLEEVPRSTCVRVCSEKMCMYFQACRANTCARFAIRISPHLRRSRSIWELTRATNRSDAPSARRPSPPRAISRYTPSFSPLFSLLSMSIRVFISPSYSLLSLSLSLFVLFSLLSVSFSFVCLLSLYLYLYLFLSLFPLYPPCLWILRVLFTNTS